MLLVKGLLGLFLWCDIPCGVNAFVRREIGLDYWNLVHTGDSYCLSNYREIYRKDGLLIFKK